MHIWLKKNPKKNIACKADLNITKTSDKSHNSHTFYFYFKPYVIKLRYYDVQFKSLKLGL